MENFNISHRISNAIFRRLCGVTREKFGEMLEKVEPVWLEEEAKKKVSGRPFGIGGLREHLFLLLILYRCGITQEFAGALLFKVDKSTICHGLKRIEKIAAPVLGLKKEIKITKEEAEGLIIDCTEQRVQRPKYGQQPYYSGKKKCHTLKTEIVVTGAGRIVAVSDSHPGSVHDLTVRRCGTALPAGSHAYLDGAYQGYDKEHAGPVDYPYRKPKGGELTEEEKDYNSGISSYRVKVEHKIGDLKVFRMLSDRYRYPREKYNQKFQIIAGIVNVLSR